MKRYITYIFAAAMIFLAAGCNTERVVTLDGSVDERINALIEDYVDELIASEHGWMVSINSVDGYYRFWMDFDEGDRVTMLTDNTRYVKYKTEPQESTYAFRAYQRPTLVFDTYSYLSIINDPDNNISGGSNNKGLITDFEFEVVKFEPGYFTMQGRFNKVAAIFKKASEKDKKGAHEGLMMDRINTLYNDLKNYYISAETSTTNIIMKIYDRRITYKFWYNEVKQTGEDGRGYYNVEVDGTNDLFFPESLKVDDMEITGLRYNEDDDMFDAFYVKDGAALPVTVSLNPPSFPLSKVFGFYGDGKLYNAAITTSGLVGALPDNTNTKSSLDLFYRFMAMGGSFNLILSYAQEYFFTRDDNDRTFFNIFMAPQGFGFNFDGDVSAVTTYETALYTFPITLENADGTRFRTSSSVTMNPGGQKYYSYNVTNLLVDNFKNRTFEIVWSEVGLNEALIVEFRGVEDHQGTPRSSFAPPAALYQR